MREPLRVGVLIDADTVSHPVRELLRVVESTPSLRVVAVIVAPATASRTHAAARAALRRFESALAAGLGDGDAARHYARYPIERMTVRVDAERGPLQAQLESLRLDVLCWCAAAAPATHDARAAPRGVLAFEPPLDPLAGAGVAALRECLQAEDNAEFAIVLHDAADRNGRVLRRGSTFTRLTLARTQAALATLQIDAMRAALSAIASSARAPVPPQVLRPRPALAPSAPAIGRYALHTGARMLRKLGQSLSGRQPYWTVSFQRTHWVDLRARAQLVAHAPPGRFFADPFVAHDPRTGRAYCFVEEFDERIGRAHIALLEIDRDGVQYRGPVLQKPFHLSFPYVFRVGDEMFMCPEMVEARRIEVYRAVEFPIRWEPHAVLMDDVRAVDSMIFDAGGRWWLMTNIDPGGDAGYPQLHLFHADTPFGSNWQPHPQNPIRIDSEGARNAGLLRDGDTLYRCGQIHGFDLYGKAVAIHRIVELTPTRYREEPVRIVAASQNPEGWMGLHHVSSDQGLLAFDFCRRRRPWIERLRIRGSGA
ncbi:MAG TPA: hypothetical protein VM491_02780 [Burkholderiaceae bacterium]|nr:hypothetical protein [Burkholderiaceae bacterium]